MGLIPIRQVADGERPGDTQLRIQWVQAALCLCGIRSGVAIEDFNVIAQGLESMSDSLGDQQGPRISRREDFGMMLKKGLRAAPEIHRDIPDLTTQAGDELHFRPRRPLKVHPSDDTPFTGSGEVDLHQPPLVENLRKIAGAEDPGKITARVDQGFPADHPNSREGSSLNFKT
jgi:hypothetical protein